MKRGKKKELEEHFENGPHTLKPHDEHAHRNQNVFVKFMSVIICFFLAYQFLIQSSVTVSTHYMWFHLLLFFVCMITSFAIIYRYLRFYNAKFSSIVILLGFVLTIFLPVFITYNTGGNVSTKQHQLMFYLVLVCVVAVACVAIVLFQLRLLNYKWIIALLWLLGMGIVYRAHVVTRSWPMGLFHDSLEYYDGSSCQIHPAFPFRQLFPTSVLKLITGYDSCSMYQTPLQLKMNGTIDENGILQMWCPPDTIATYQIDPNFFDLVENKTYLLEDFQGVPLTSTGYIPSRASNSHVFKYKAPVKLPESSEWVSIFCNNEEQFLLRPIKKAAVSERKLPDTKDPYSVMFLMLDAVSRAEFHFSLPKTSQQLQLLDVQGNSRVFEFFRYHAVAHNTKPNLTPFFTGYPIDDYVSIRQDMYNASKQRKPLGMFFHWFQENGYATSFMNGQCADYYRLFWNYTVEEDKFRGIDHECVLPFCHPSYTYGYSTSPTWNGPYAIRPRCLGNRNVHSYMLDYLQSFWQLYSERPKISFTSFLEGHEGGLAVLPSIDEDLANFLGKIDTSSTFVILFADHGNHMSPWYYGTHSGKMERSLPSLFMIAPKKFLKQHPQALRQLKLNKHRLVTVYDVYATMEDLLRLTQERSEVTDSFSAQARARMQLENGKHWLQVPQSSPAFAYSLFSPIPSTRNCNAAKIDPFVCMCA